MSERRMMDVEKSTIQYQPDPQAQTAMGLMRDDFLLVPEHITVGQALDMIRDPRYYTNFFNAYICSIDQKLGSMRFLVGKDSAYQSERESRS